MKKTLHVFIVLLFCFLFFIYPHNYNIQAQWPTNCDETIEICGAVDYQTYPQIINTGSDEFIITWVDDRSGSTNQDIYAQKLNSSGEIQWTSDGVAICTETGNQHTVRIVPDGSGGAIIVWVDERTSDIHTNVFAQRVNSEGVVQWQVNGALVCAANLQQEDIEAISDNNGGVFVVWSDNRRGTTISRKYDVYAQRLDSDGSAHSGWDADGQLVFYDKSYRPDLCFDGSDGIIIVSYRDDDITASRLAGDGTTTWSYANICDATDYQRYPQIVRSGSNTFVIAWIDRRNGNPDIYSQAINVNGTELWPTSSPDDLGVAICTNSSQQQQNFVLESDSAGGAFIVWEDLRSGSTEIYLQKINSTGVVEFASDGIEIPTTASVYTPNIIEDGSNGVYVTWREDRNSTNTMCMITQRINSSGSKLWDDAGIVACNIGTANQVLTKDQSDNLVSTCQGGYGIIATRVMSNGALPVELTSFDASIIDNEVLLTWQTATEVNNYGFQVQRQKKKVQSEEWETIGFVDGSGTTNSPKSYSYTDSDLPDAKELSYRLKQIDNDGTFSYSKIIRVDLTSITDVGNEKIEYEFSLQQNYPNPFNPSTTIKFTIPSVGTTHKLSMTTKLMIYDVLGREIKTLVNKPMQPGNYEVEFNAGALPSGIYFYKLQSGKQVQTQKMVLLR